VAESDQERVLRALREVLDAPGTSARHLAAKASAAHQLSKLQGLAEAGEPAGDERWSAPDPMGDLDEVELQRRKRARIRRHAS
jgi:hypothetical protein